MNNFNAPKFVYKTGSLSHAGDGLVVQGSINRQRCRITIDTGSNISIVRPDVLGDTIARTIQPVTSCLKTVTGEQAPIGGRAKLMLQIGRQTYEHDTWVADIADECLLGLDFLVPQACQVDFKDGVLYIGDEEIHGWRNVSPTATERLSLVSERTSSFRDDCAYSGERLTRE